LRSPIPLIISAALFGCPSHNQECGPPSSGSATAFGLVVGTTIQTSYGNLSSSEAHDCVDPNAPAGVVSLTITGFQTGGTGGLFTACIPRPDELATQAVSLGSGVQIVDFTGSANGCTYTFDATQPITGTVTADGLCGEGSAGYSLTFDGGLSVDRTCGSAVDTVPLTLSGDVIVSGS
jgi:hypothetical protein